MEANAVIASIEAFLKTDSEIKKSFEFAINNDHREETLDKCKDQIARLKKWEEGKELPDVREFMLADSKQYNHFSPERLKRHIESRKRWAENVRLEKANDLARANALKGKIANKEIAIVEFNRLVQEVSNSALLIWLKQECNLSRVLKEIMRKKIPSYMPIKYMDEPFEINDSYYLVLLVRIIANPIFNYLSVPKDLPNRATFQRAEKLAVELLHLINEHKSLTPFNDRKLINLKKMLLEVGNDYLSQPRKSEKTIRVMDKGTVVKKTESVIIQPRESLTQIRYEELRKTKLRLLIEDIGINYIDTFSLLNTKKGRPHAELILDIIPHSCLEEENIPDVRTVQRWLKNLDGFGRTELTYSNQRSVPLIYRFINDPKLNV